MSNTQQSALNQEHGATKTELLPCPFCGAQPVTEFFEDEEDHFHFISCNNEACPANVYATSATPEEAAARWNTRNGGAA